jgi:predicted RNA-binding Zn-ribbon protein involved in translation (DUF1610 family)
MLIIKEGVKQQKHNPYKNYIYKCNKCELELKIEESDLDNLIYRTAKNWYELNIPCYHNKEVFIKCPNCGDLIPVETAQTIGFSTRIKNVGKEDKGE